MSPLWVLLACLEHQTSKYPEIRLMSLKSRLSVLTGSAEKTPKAVACW